MLKVGCKFYTFEELIKKLDEYQRLEDVQLYLSDSQTISDSAKRSLRKSLNPLLKYSEITYSCILKGLPQETLKSRSVENCPFKVCLASSCDGRSLVVSEICHNHNHENLGPNNKINNPVNIDEEIAEIYVDRNAETEAAKELIEFSHKEFRKRKISENSYSPSKKVKSSINSVEPPLEERNIMSSDVVTNAKDIVREKPTLVSESSHYNESKLIDKGNQITKPNNFAKENVVDVVSRKLNINSELTLIPNISSKSSLSPNLNNDVIMPKIHAKSVAQINLEPENFKSSDIKLGPNISCNDGIVSIHTNNANFNVSSNNGVPNTNFSIENKEPISYVSSIQTCSPKPIQEVIISEDSLPSRAESPVVNVDPLEDTSENGPDLGLKIENVFRTNEASFDSNQFHEDANNFVNSPQVNLLSMSDIYIGKGYPYDLFIFKCNSCKVSFNLEKDFVVHNRSPIHYKATMAERQTAVPDKTSNIKNVQKPSTAAGVKNCLKSNYKGAESVNCSKGPVKIKSNKATCKTKLNYTIDGIGDVIKISNEIPMKNILQPVPYIPLNLIKRRIIIIGELDNRENFIKQQNLKANSAKIHNNNSNNNKCDLPIMFVPYQVKVRSAETGEFKFVMMYLPHFDTETSSMVMKDCWSIPDNSWIGEVDEPIKREMKVQFNDWSSAAMDEIKVDKVIAPVSDVEITTPHKRPNVSTSQTQKVNVNSYLDKKKILPTYDILNNCFKCLVPDVAEAQKGKKFMKRVSWKDQSSKVIPQSTNPPVSHTSFIKTLGHTSVHKSPPQIRKKNDRSANTCVPGPVDKKLDLYIDSLISNNDKITGIGGASKLPISHSNRENSSYMTQVPRDNYLTCQKYFPHDVKNVPILKQKFAANNSDALDNNKTYQSPKPVLLSTPQLGISSKINEPCRSSTSSNINKLISNPSPGTPNSVKIKPTEFKLLKIPILKLRRIEKLTHLNIKSSVKDVNSFIEGSKAKTVTDNLESCHAKDFTSKVNKVECSPTKKAVTDVNRTRFNYKSPPILLRSTIGSSELNEVSHHLDLKASRPDCITGSQSCSSDKAISLPQLGFFKELKTTSLPMNAHSERKSENFRKSSPKEITGGDKSKSLVKHLEENSKYISALLNEVSKSNTVTEDEYDHMPSFQKGESPVTNRSKSRELFLSPMRKDDILMHKSISDKSPVSKNSRINDCLSLSPSKTNKYKIALFNTVLNKIKDGHNDDPLSTYSMKDQKNKECTNISPSKCNEINCDTVEKVTCDPSFSNDSLGSNKHNLVINMPSVYTEIGFEDMKNNADLVIANETLTKRLSGDVKEVKLENNVPSKSNELSKSDKSLENQICDHQFLNRPTVDNLENSIPSGIVIKNKIVYSKTVQNSSIVDKSLNADSKGSDNSETDAISEISSAIDDRSEDKLLNEIDEQGDCHLNENNSVSYISLLNDMDYNEPSVLEKDQPDISKEVLKYTEANLSLSHDFVSLPLIKKPVCLANEVPEFISEVNNLKVDASNKQGTEDKSVISLSVKEKLKETSNCIDFTKCLDSNTERLTGSEQSKNSSTYATGSSLKDEVDSPSTLNYSQPVLTSQAANATTVDCSQVKRSFNGTILKVRRNSLHQSIIKTSDVIKRSNSHTFKDDDFKNRIIKGSKVIGLSCVTKIEKSVDVSNELFKTTDETDGNIIMIKTSNKDPIINQSIKKSLEVISKLACNQIQENSGDKKSEDNDLKLPKVIVVSGVSKKEPLPTALTPRVVEIAKNVNKVNQTSSVQVINADSGNRDLPGVNQVANIMDEVSTKVKLSQNSTLDNPIRSKVSGSSSTSTPYSSPKVYASHNEESLNRFHYKDSDNDEQRDSKYEDEDYVDKLRDNSTPGDNLSLVDENEWQDNLADFEADGEDGYCRLLQDM